MQVETTSSQNSLRMKIVMKFKKKSEQMFLNIFFLFLYIWGYTVVALPNRKRKKLTQERAKKKSRDNRL